jgi:TonB family protein
MAGLIRYMVLANLSLVLIALFYHIFLSRETWFRSNRFILLGGTLLSLFLPLFNFSWITPGSYTLLSIPEIIITAKSGMPHFNLDEIQIFGTAPYVFPWFKVGMTIYFAGALATGLLLIWRFKRVQAWTRRYPMKWFRDLYITLLPEHFSPFSFLGIVYYPNPLDKSSSQSKMILDHEKVHIRQKHSWDIIFIETVRILFFYNPAVYTIKKQMQINHEYIADNEAVGKEKRAYSQELIRSQLQVPQFQFIQPFNQSSYLKRRLIMIMKEKTRTAGKLKYLMFLPVTAAILWFSACTDESDNTGPASAGNENLKVQSFIITDSPAGNYAEAILNSDYADLNTKEKQAKAIAVEMKKTGATDKEVENFMITRIKSWTENSPGDIESSKVFQSGSLKIEDLVTPAVSKSALMQDDGEKEVFYKVEEMPAFDGEQGGKGLEKFRDWVQLNVKYPDIAKENGISGTVYVNFIIDKEGRLTDVGIVRGVDPSLDDEVERVLQSSPDWKPGKQRGKNVNVKMAIPVKFALQ